MNRETELITTLFKIRFHYDKASELSKLHILEELALTKALRPKQIKVYKDVLNAIMAYPGSNAVYAKSLTEQVRTNLLIRKNKSLQQKLDNSGLKYCNTYGSFSFELTDWLYTVMPGAIKVDSIGADEDKIISTLYLVSGEVAAEILLEKHITWKNWLRQFQLSKNNDWFPALLMLFRNSDLNSKIKEELWCHLKLVFRVNTQENMVTGQEQLPFNSTVFYHKEINKNPKQNEIFKIPVREIKLKKSEREMLLRASRLTLLGMQRETDPVTYSNAELTKYYDAGKGVTIALFEMPATRRQPIDSYIGYMAFKNGLPIAYGGGWILFDTCRFGTNIFPSFRGGESAKIISQILHTYHSIFNIHRFSVDPYQIGKNNPDGIKSGAFWTYYKMGFKPEKEKYVQMAKAEFEQIVKNKMYRTSNKVLEQLSLSEPVLHISKTKHSFPFDAARLSIIYQKILKKNFQGDSKFQHLIIDSFIDKEGWRINPIKRNIALNWLKICLHNPKATIPKPVMKEIKQAILLKSTGKEYHYIDSLNSFRSLRSFMKELGELYLVQP